MKKFLLNFEIGRVDYLMWIILLSFLWKPVVEIIYYITPDNFYLDYMPITIWALSFVYILLIMLFTVARLRNIGWNPYFALLMIPLMYVNEITLILGVIVYGILFFKKGRSVDSFSMRWINKIKKKFRKI